MPFNRGRRKHDDTTANFSEHSPNTTSWEQELKHLQDSFGGAASWQPSDSFRNGFQVGHEHGWKKPGVALVRSSQDVNDEADRSYEQHTPAPAPDQPAHYRSGYSAGFGRGMYNRLLDAADELDRMGYTLPEEGDF
jgi:hypothetical protein